MVMVMPVRVAVAATVVQDPGHSLSRVLVHEEHRIHRHAHNALLASEALRNAGQLRRQRQAHLQISDAGQEGAPLRPLLSPQAATTTGGIARSTASTAGTASATGTASTTGTASATGTASGTAASGTAASTTGTAASTTVLAVIEVHTRMVAKCKDVSPGHFRQLVIEAKAAPLRVWAVCLNVQRGTANHLERPGGSTCAAALREGELLGHCRDGQREQR